MSALVPHRHAYAVTVVDTFSKAMRLMRKHDPQSQEDGFGMLEPIAAEVLPQLIAEFETESDHALRCWLLELIGHAQSPNAVPILSGTGQQRRLTPRLGPARARTNGYVRGEGSPLARCSEPVALNALK